MKSSAPKSNSPPVKPANVFSDDGSFLDRIRRSMKDEDENRKEKEALERKRKFPERFKNRRKRSANPITNDSPNKKPKLDAYNQEPKPETLQANYHKVIGSYSESLKEEGTGIRPRQIIC